MTEVVFEEASAAERVERLPLAHLSIEVGHLYFEDFRSGPRRIIQLLDDVAPWEHAIRERCTMQLRPAAARISTCFLIDDYFTRFSSPRELVPHIAEAARQTGVQIDYLAREAGCARAGDVDLARLVLARLVPDPPPGSTGLRPPVTATGWLCNGERSPQQELSEAMRAPTVWRPPSENGANRHSVFVDVQLWDEVNDERIWSCPYLAAVWQLLRLGLLRHEGKPVVTPVRVQEYPETWPELPPIIQLAEQAAPFSAFRTVSVLGDNFLPIEHAVRTILGQVDVDQAIRSQMVERAAAERPPLLLPAEVVKRITYVFTGSEWR
jgi:hypothetical protein